MLVQPIGNQTYTMSESRGFLSRIKQMSPKVTRKYAPPKPYTTEDGVPDKLKSTDIGKQDTAKVTQNEVEEKLKAMRQKRLSRLNVFVADQVKLSESRSHDNDIEEAIVSIKKVETESLGSSFKSTKDVDNQTNLSRKDSGNDDSSKKTSSAKKFINKFNCVNHNLTTSNDDLTVLETTNTSRHSLPTNIDEKQPITKKNNTSSSFNKLRDKEIQSDSYKMNTASRKTLYHKEDDDILDLPPRSSSRNQSYTTHLQIISREEEGIPDLPPRNSTHRTFGKVEVSKKFAGIQPKEDIPQRPPKIFTYETFGKHNNEFPKKVFGVKSKNNQNYSTEKTENSSSNLSHTNNSGSAKGINYNKSSYENVTISGIKTGPRIETIEMKQSEEHSNDVNKLPDKTKSKLYENIRIRNDEFGVVEPREIPKIDTPRSPLPLPRKTNQDEKALKKFQASYLTLREILENDSEVDFDELEDLKATFDEASYILDDYKLKLNQLEAKLVPSNKLEVIRKKIADIKSSLTTFKGLKRDVSYLDLSNRLSSYFFDIKNDASKGEEGEETKKVLLVEVDRCIKDLEEKVARNETILRQVLEEQVMLIVTHRLIPTIV